MYFFLSGRKGKKDSALGPFFSMKMQNNQVLHKKEKNLQLFANNLVLVSLKYPTNGDCRKLQTVLPKICSFVAGGGNCRKIIFFCKI